MNYLSPALVLALAIAGRAQPAGERVSGGDVARFGGEITRGQKFEQKVFRNLLFRLAPSPQGWAIQVVDPGHADRDYSGIATPPFRGTNALNIEGWHFRNADNSGPNDGEVNAPQHEREFRFYLDEAAYAAGAACLEKLLWPAGRSKEEVESAGKTCRELWSRAGEGRLTIREMKLGNLEPGGQAWIEWMRFEVELRAPALQSAGDS
jgi:hypothetical protein